MIEISPAILTSEIDDFKNQLNELSGFNSIDIDIIRRPFVDNTTLQIADVIDFLEDIPQINFGFHLMVENPIQDIEFLMTTFFKEKKLRVYFHQEAEISSLSDFKWPDLWQRGITVKLETVLNSVEFYKDFPEVQLMSIETGHQGNEFDKKILTKVKTLRKEGYKGKISLDGGINLETAAELRNAELDRVSVGSVFSKSHKDKEMFVKLNNILNSTK